MSPEAILGGNNNIHGVQPMRVGRASDVWALGCILYQMVHGATPFAALPFIQKMHAITDPSHAIVFPRLRNAALQAVLKGCLDRNPATRLSVKVIPCAMKLHLGGSFPASFEVFPRKPPCAQASASCSFSSASSSFPANARVPSLLFPRLARCKTAS